MERVIKFRIIHKGKIVGYEVLTETGWKWNWIELNPDGGGDRWCTGVVHDSTPTAMLRCQFTGLHDKDGKEIYEGDIVETPTVKNMVIGWSEKFASFVIERDGWAFQHWFGEAMNPQYCKVIGNIFSNPELLK